MNSQVQSNVVKQRAAYEKVCDFKIQSGFLLCPREDLTNGVMYLVSTAGDLFTFNEGSSELITTFSGEPYAICFDNNGYFYISDMLSNSIFYKYGCKSNFYLLIF